MSSKSAAALSDVAAADEVVATRSEQAEAGRTRPIWSSKTFWTQLS